MKPSVILLGTKPGSVTALKILLAARWDVQYVIVPVKFDIDWIEGPELKDVALAEGLKVLDSQLAIPDDTKVDYVLSYMYRNLVKDRTLSFATKAALNFHAGPLPRFGGWAFYNVAILENVTEYGPTCHYMDNGFDTGPLLKVKNFPVNAKEETAYSLERKTQVAMIELFQEFISLVENGIALPKVEQDPKEMRYMNMEEFKELKQIPVDADAETIDRYARAFWYPPYECAYTTINGVKIEIIPEIAKKEVATRLHQDDLTMLSNRIHIS
jgi:methionyl-tRNA formyltransferase